MEIEDLTVRSRHCRRYCKQTVMKQPLSASGILFQSLPGLTIGWFWMIREIIIIRILLPREIPLGIKDMWLTSSPNIVKTGWVGARIRINLFSWWCITKPFTVIGCLPNGIIICTNIRSSLYPIIIMMHTKDVMRHKCRRWIYTVICTKVTTWRWLRVWIATVCYSTRGLMLFLVRWSRMSAAVLWMPIVNGTMNFIRNSVLSKRWQNGNISAIYRIIWLVWQAWTRV